MSFPSYPEYKESGVQWLADVPGEWRLCKFKHLASICNGKDYKEVQVDNGEYPVIGSGGAFARTNSYLYNGESVLLGRKGTVDQPLYVRGRFWTVDTMFYTTIQPEVNGRFLYYYATQFPFGFYSTNTALPSMAQEDLANLPMAVPKKAEQTQIARFLDHETARIDALIAEQERLIELLGEKRQAVISHAVTKGLDPDAPMKDSGVEWLGEVPAHWDITRLKFFSRIVDCKNRTPEYFDDGEYLVVRTSNVRDQAINTSGAYYTNKENFRIWTQRGIPPEGSILFTREAPAGEVCLVPEGLPLCLGQRMMNVIPNEPRHTAFLFDFLTSDCLVRYIESVSHGSTVSHLRVEQVYEIPLAIPPLNEQGLIDKKVSILKTKFSSLITEADKNITLLNERRSALISAAVTGKIDVRDWQPPASETQPSSAQAEIPA